jgi:hypothetical protein
MTRSKFSTKALLLATGIGLSVAAFAGSQPAAAQAYSGCPAGNLYQPPYGCTVAGWMIMAAIPNGLYYRYHNGFNHGFAHGMGAEGHDMGLGHGVGFAHFGGGGFHGMGGGGHR